MNAHPKDIANWLTVALAQRKRAAVKMAQTYGPSSPATVAIEQDVAAIQEAITEFTKEAAKTPLKK